MSKKISYGAVIYRKEKNKILYLLLYRKARKNYIEMWDFPRGLIEKGETPKEDVKREIREETGIRNLKFIKGFRKKVRWFYKKEGKIIFKEATYFLAGTKTKKVRLDFEHDKFRWCTFEEALKLIKFSNRKNVLKKADKLLKEGLDKFLE